MRYLMPALAAAASVLSTAPGSADLGDQLAKLLADDGAANDLFGISVAISGATAIVGATFDEDNGAESGSAYLFDISDPRKPTQIAKVLPNDGAASDVFGVSVAISGATVIVGADGDDDNGSQSGSAYLFDISNPANPTQIAKLLPNDGAAGDRFGFSVAICGETAIVGAVWDDDNGIDAGAAYLFDSTTGRQIAKLLANDGAAADIFGGSVAISGTTAIIGAHLDDDNGQNSGSAYVFDTTRGRQIAKLLPDDGAAGDAFGDSVAISGATAIIGAWRDDDNGTWSGSAYLFDVSDPKNSVQIAKLLANDGAELNSFGFSVAISGTTAIIGAGADDDNGKLSGSAYLFDTTTGRQLVKLLPDDGAADDFFGFAVAISGTTAIVGALWDDDNGDFSGSAYLFDAAASGTCPWDLDGDGTVGAGDLVILVQNFGPCDGECPADFDEDGFVGVLDLLILLANFGQCPGTDCPWDVNGDGVVDHLDVRAVNDNLGPCKDPDNCPWDVNGDGVVDGVDVSEVASHFGPCPKE